ncbi:MAG: DUF839 domain-containing protein [Phycisphaerales bacterium]|nr:PhoX family protein [Phycisphaerae bacterium]NNM25202.1 DUF839 domain-containing protein [Phycisphaerales bacterium]
MLHPSRREILSRGGTLALGFIGLQRWIDTDLARRVPPHESPLGPLRPDPARMLELPDGFAYRVISCEGDPMDDGLLVPGLADGMAAFPGPDGTVRLVRNHEIESHTPRYGAFGTHYERLDRVDQTRLFDAGFGRTPALGGTTTIEYDLRTRRVRRQFLSLGGTVRNCAGGPTPWGSWITCEETQQHAGPMWEHDHGYNFEVPADANELVEAVPLRAMGRFYREAVAVDPATSIVYQTQDLDDGLIYRFLPDVPQQLARGGRLQTLGIRDRPVCDTRNWSGGTDSIRVGSPLETVWIDVDGVDNPHDDLRHRGAAAGGAVFARAEGMWFAGGVVYFACTNGGPDRTGQIWRYRPSPREGRGDEQDTPGRLELFVESRNEDLLRNADNLTIAPWGDLIVCEDGAGHDRIVGITPEGTMYVIARNAMGADEFAGPSFAPDGSTLFVNIQQSGLTVAIDLPQRLIDRR